MDINELKPAIKAGDIVKIKQIMAEHNLEIVDGKIKAKDSLVAKSNVDFWNQRQQARKILLDSQQF